MSDDHHGDGEPHLGIPAIVSATVALVTIAATRFPDLPWLGALAKHPTETTQIVTFVVAAAGVVGSVVAKPPTWLRSSLCRTWATLKSLATWGAHG